MAPATMDDSMPARITPDCPDDTRDVLYHAWAHDTSDLKKILRNRGNAGSVQDPKTGETPLHAAIRACGPADEPEAEGQEEDGCVEEAREVVQELFLAGAIWNDVDNNNETPGCLAWRLGRKSLYGMCVDAGVRAELLLTLMEGYEELSSDSEDGESGDKVVQEAKGDGAGEDEEMTDVKSGNDDTTQENGGAAAFVAPEAGEKPVTSEEYLKSDLTYDEGKLIDSDLNGVMMAWETGIMRRSVAALLPEQATGKRILNIGFGMGIIDGMFAEHKPSRHHIIEAHPAVLEHVSKPDSKFGPEWEKSGPEEGAYKIHAGRWQEIVPKLLEQGEVYDAIYFDTFGEDYAQLRHFFTELIPGVMDQDGRFSFFNGLGADRRICYDVYTKVVEMHGEEGGLDFEWQEIDVDMSALAEEGKGDWEGVRRRYWTLDSESHPHPSSPAGFQAHATQHQRYDFKANIQQSIDCPYAHSWASKSTKLTKLFLFLHIQEIVCRGLNHLVLWLISSPLSMDVLSFFSFSFPFPILI